MPHRDRIDPMEEDSRVVVDEDEVEIEGVVVVEVSLIYISF